MKTLVWTRPASDWVTDEILLKTVQGKAQVLRLPCVEIKPLKVAGLAKSYDVFVFTSSKAAQVALANAEVLAQVQAAKNIYTHGPSTAKTLARLGLKADVIAARTGAELAVELAKIIPPGTPVAWPRVEDPAHDIQADLTAAGIPTDSFVCYRTLPGIHDVGGHTPPKEQLEEWKETLEGVVCFASPSAVEGFLKGLAGTKLVAVALGPTTAKACERHFKIVRTATENGIEALVKAAALAL
jgi:uroporphyrinogen-III synthase